MNNITGSVDDVGDFILVDESGVHRASLVRKHHELCNDNSFMIFKHGVINLSLIEVSIFPSRGRFLFLSFVKFDYFVILRANRELVAKMIRAHIFDFRNDRGR